MTREEAIICLQGLLDNPLINKGSYLAQAIEMAIQALSQEPCDDAISREDAEQMFRNIRSHLKPQDYKSAEEFNTRDLMLLNAEQMIHALPSVTHKSGKWINDKNDMPICSRCGYIPQYDRAIDDYEYSNYCPSCGCRMVEPQESEE